MVRWKKQKPGLIKISLLVLGVMVGFGCGGSGGEGNSDSTDFVSDLGDRVFSVSKRYLSLEERPTCDDEQVGQIIFVASTKEFQYCQEEKQWVSLVLNDFNIKTSLDAIVCQDGQDILKYSDGVWVCEEQRDQLEDLRKQCQEGQFLIWNDDKKNWVCSFATTIGSLQDCGVGDIPKLVKSPEDSSLTWKCSVPEGKDTLASLRPNCSTNSLAQFKQGAWICFPLSIPSEFLINEQKKNLATKNKGHSTKVVLDSQGSSQIKGSSGLTYEIIGGRDAHLFEIKKDGDKDWLYFSSEATTLTDGFTYYVLIEARNPFGMTRNQLFAVKIEPG